MADIAKIKRNIGKMIDQDAPEQDIDSYVASEGITLEQLHGSSQPEEHPLSAQYVGQEPSAINSILKRMIPMSGVADPLIGEMVKNAPESAYEFGKNIYTAVRHPIETTKTIGNVALGAMEKLTPGEGMNEPSANAVGQFFVERYGGLDKLRNTMATDPIGFLADASALLTVGGAGISKIPGLAKTGQTMKQLGRASEPVNIAIEGTKAIGKPVLGSAKRVATEVLGKTTGTGAGAVEQALKGGKEFTESMRGKVSEADVLETTQNALQNVKNQRSQAYKVKLAEVGRNTSQLDIAPVKKSLDSFLDAWHIKKTGKPIKTGAHGAASEGLDFKRSVMAKDIKTQNEVLQMVDLIEGWDDFSPIGVDVLKRNLDDFYTETGKGRAIAAGLKNETRKVLSDNVPGYADMTAEYAKTSKLTKDIEKALSLSKTSGADTSIRKISQIMRENFTYRRDLVRQLEGMTGTDIQSAVAGIQLNRLTPKGLQGTLATSGVAAAMYFLHPVLAITLPMASPRAVGEFLNLIGNTSRQIKALGAKAQQSGIGRAVSVPVRQTAFQAGRIQDEANK